MNAVTGKQHGFLKKLKIELRSAAIPFLGIFPKKTKTLSQKDSRTPIFTAAFHIQDIEATYIFTIDRCSVYTQTHTMEYYSTIKKNEILLFAQHGRTERVLC